MQTQTREEKIVGKTEKENTETKTFMQMVEEVTPQRTGTFVKKIEAAFDERAKHEADAAPANSSIQSKLKKERAKMVAPAIAALTLAAEVDPGFINRSNGENTAKRYNVYAIGKLTDLLQGLKMGHLKNAVNLCVVRSLFALNKADRPFTGDLARAAVSGALPVSKEDDAIMTRHTAAASTAPTQASSTMSALTTLGVVTNTGTVKHPTYVLTDNPVVERLREVVAA